MSAVHSQISICNSALALIGETFIRSLNENSTKARMCQVQYDIQVDALLTRIDWPFARAVATLNELVIPEEQQIPGKKFYALPSNCLMPRYLVQQDGRHSFEVMGNALVTALPNPRLVYTRDDTTEFLFSPAFVHLLSLSLAIRISPALTQDKILTSSLKNLFEYEFMQAAEVEANTDNVYRFADEQPEHDTFVNPDNAYSSFNE